MGEKEFYNKLEAGEIIPIKRWVAISTLLTTLAAVLVWIATVAFWISDVDNSLSANGKRIDSNEKLIEANYNVFNAKFELYEAMREKQVIDNMTIIANLKSLLRNQGLRWQTLETDKIN